ncbi:hypothetical protein M413DRAFT_28483 [Hebeloma cylindrosporum]|uniref:Uncharacterized protein n=1 Tax=Hebeloma cylindrosporum TaxID=76867 RepID=A0A0C2XSM9_HEBCY|nr:hypothetical protein M413DRAFT_28483 [Hebeloma cylindrosporum h7]
MDDHDISNEETRSWNSALPERNKGRPGPGILSAVFAEELHDSDHSLFSVKVTVPLRAVPQSPPVPDSDHAAVLDTPPSSNLQSSLDHCPPTKEEVRTSIPHPNAYYCPEDNGWVILSWNTSSVAPPLARSYIASGNPPLPDQSRRRQVSRLNTAIRRDGWASVETVKQKMTDLTIRDEADTPGDYDVESAEEEGELLDLYVCCQCSFYCVVSAVIPGVVPRRHLEELVRDRTRNRSAGTSAEQAVASANKALLVAVENKLWKGNNRWIKLFSTGFQTNVGWNANIKRIFELLGFVEVVTKAGDRCLKPPLTDPTFPAGKQNRRQLLRAWLEIASWRTNFKRINGINLQYTFYHMRPYVQLDSASETYQKAIGAHRDQIYSRGLSESMLVHTNRSLEVAWRGLGLTPTTYSADLLGFSFLAQCRCDPARTPQYFTYLTAIVKELQESGGCPPQLEELLAMEESRGRFTSEDLATAATILGFGVDVVLDVGYGEYAEDQLVEDAWVEKRSWCGVEHGPAGTRGLIDGARTISAESRDSVELRKTPENDKEVPYHREYAISPPTTPQPQEQVTSLPDSGWPTYIPFPTANPWPPLTEQGPQQHLATQPSPMLRFIQDEQGMLIAVYQPEVLAQYLASSG